MISSLVHGCHSFAEFRLRLSHWRNIRMHMAALSRGTAHSNRIGNSVGRATNISTIDGVTAELSSVYAILHDWSWLSWGCIDRIGAEFLRDECGVIKMVLNVILIIALSNELMCLACFHWLCSVVWFHSRLICICQTCYFSKLFLAFCHAEVLLQATWASSAWLGWSLRSYSISLRWFPPRLHLRFRSISFLEWPWLFNI